MTDFKGINPDKNIGAKFTSNRQSGNYTPPNLPQNDTPASDPYADRKMNPNDVLNLMSNQAQLNFTGVRVENPSIERFVTNFAQTVSPEQHAHYSQLMDDVYSAEFPGKKPSAGLRQEMLDNYLIGIPVIDQ